MISKNMSEFAYLDQTTDSTSGFTNHWLQSRHANNLFKERYPDHSLFSGEDKTKYSEDDSIYYRDITKHIQQRTPVSDFFFSKLNIDHLKKLICKQVKNNFKTKHNRDIHLDPQSQSTQELLTVMRAIYLQKLRNPIGQFSENHITKKQTINNEIARLNQEMIYELLPKMYSSIMMELTYQRDASQMPISMDNPINVSSAGTRSQELFSERMFI